MGGIIYLPFGHVYLEEARKLKSKFRAEVTTGFINQLFDFIDAEQNALKNCERIRIFQTILNQPPQLYMLHSNVIARSRYIKNTQEYIVNESWK